MANQSRLTEYIFASSDGSREYTAIVYSDHTTSCNCRGWTVKKANRERECRHTICVESGTATIGDNLVTGKVIRLLRIEGSESHVRFRAPAPTVPIVAEAEALMARLKDKPKKESKEKKPEAEPLTEPSASWRDIEPMAAGVLKGMELERVWDSMRWIAEEKLDGARYVLHLHSDKNRLFSRRKSSVDGKRIERTDNTPHLRDLKHDLDGTILDGEIVTSEGCKANDVTRVMGSHPDRAVDAQEKIGYVRYVVFDIIQYKGKDLCGEPYHVRKGLLDDVLAALDCEYLSTPKRATTGKREFCEEIIKAGGEGVILKDLDGKYTEGARPTCWAKVKRENNWNVICTGFTKGKNAMADTFGAIKFSMYVNGVLTEVGQCSGMTLKVRQEVHENREAYLGKVLEVTGQEITEGGRIRHPRFKGWRLDVDPKTCKAEDEARSI